MIIDFLTFYVDSLTFKDSSLQSTMFNFLAIKILDYVVQVNQICIKA